MEANFERFVEQLCAPHYTDNAGRPGIDPGMHFRMLLVGYFKVLGSRRGIAWRCRDSLSLREFLGLVPDQPSPYNRSLTVIRPRLPLELFERVFVELFLARYCARWACELPQAEQPARHLIPDVPHGVRVHTDPPVGGRDRQGDSTAGQLTVSTEAVERPGERRQEYVPRCNQTSACGIIASWAPIALLDVLPRSARAIGGEAVRQALPLLDSPPRIADLQRHVVAGQVVEGVGVPGSERGFAEPR